jgi:hypothetical protein
MFTNLLSKEISEFSEISSSRGGGGEYDVQNCLLGCTVHGSASQKTILNITL